MLKTVLVALEESPYSDTATTLALDWANRFGARLLGLGILDKPSITGHEAAAFLARFQERCSSERIPAQLIQDVGDPTKCILKHAHRCDVIVLGYETNFHFETQDSPDTVRAKIVRRSPRPIVVVPRELPTGSGVVVAYGGGRERALNGLPTTLQTGIQSRARS